MKHGCALLLFFLLTQQLFAITDSLPLPALELGKRGSWLAAPEIKAKNMTERAGQGKVYFRTNAQPAFQPIGFLGRRIEPYFKGNPAAIFSRCVQSDECKKPQIL